jgi:hypothetical protein
MNGDQCTGKYKHSAADHQSKNGNHYEIFRDHVGHCVIATQRGFPPTPAPGDSWAWRPIPGADKLAAEFEEANKMLRAIGRFAMLVVVSLELGAIPASCSAATDAARLTVRGGGADLGETPVIAEVKGGLAVGVYSLEPETGGATIPAQVFQEGTRRFVAIVLPRVAMRRAEQFKLTPEPKSEGKLAKGIHFQSKAGNLAIQRDHEPLAAYWVGTGNKPFLYPLIGPTGASYTRAFPMLDIPGEDRDHPHQRSCWFTHGNVNGIDFWSEGKQAGRIRETSRTIVAEGPVLGRLQTQDWWLGPGERRVCTDIRTVTFYRTTGVRTIDFDFTIEASGGPVEFRDTKEGMFGLRVASTMDGSRKTGGRITNAEGVTDEAAWGQSSSWVDYVGPVDGKTVGIAVLNHPDSFRYPTAWHVRPYGLFAANPFGWHDFGKPEKGDYTIPAGGKIEFHYRVILHEGTTAAAAPERLFEGYARPPAIELVAE